MTNPHDQITSQIEMLQEDIGFLRYAYEQAPGPRERKELIDDYHELLDQIVSLEYEQIMKELS